MVLLRQEEFVRLRVGLVRGNSCYCVFHRERAVEGVSRDFWRIIRRRRSLVAHDVSQLRLDNEFPHIAKPGWMLLLLLAATHASVDYFAIVSKNVRFARFALADLRQIAFGHLACQCIVAIR